MDGACSERVEGVPWSGTSVGVVLADSGGNLLHKCVRRSLAIDTKGADAHLPPCIQQLQQGYFIAVAAAVHVAGRDIVGGAGQGQTDKPFAEVFQALGVEFDLRHVAKGKFYVSHTEARRTELKEKIGNILPSTADSLRSRLLFADAQLFGRFSKLALHRI
eukprot:s4628_g13.t1